MAPGDVPLSRILTTPEQRAVLGALPMRQTLGIDGERVRAAVAAAAERFAAPVLPEIAPRRPLPLADVRGAVQRLLDPRAAVAGVVAGSVDGTVMGPDADPTAPVAWSPRFPDPMWRPLADLAPEWILGGLGAAPADSIALAETEPAFVQSYLLGLNHEFARELRWREYPTDQRGTAFAVFWGPAPAVGPVHAWDPAGPLGAQAAGGPERVVLLIRSAMLRRYPGTVIYAVRLVDPGGGTDGGGLAPDPASETYPEFRGALDAETAFLGFAIDPGELRTGSWAFVLAEQPTEPRFGIDDGGFGAQPGDPSHATELDNPEVAQVSDAAATARATFQQPVRVIVPAAHLLGREHADG